MLQPGSRELAPLAVADTTYALPFFMQASSGDTTERERSRVTHGERRYRGERVLLTTRWAPPFTTDDSLVVQRRGLVPTRERLAAQGATRTFRYEGRRIVGTVQVGDSAPRAFDRTFAEVPFAFNEVDALVRSVPLRNGFRAIVPLFSEIDEAIEHDTITILGSVQATQRGVHSAWRIRFADPAIVALYVVDERSRRILVHEVTQRRGGTRMRYGGSTGS